MLHLAFVDEIGRGVNEEYFYRFDYTENSDVVWGDYFNIIPCAIVPNLQPEKNSLSFSEKILSKYPLELAKKNGCFSMQDCIDGIISLAFGDIDEQELYYKDSLLKFDFGEDYESVHEKIDSMTNVFNVVEKINIEKGDSSIIDDLIDSIGDNDDYNEFE